MLCDTRVSVRDMHNLSIGTGLCYRLQEGTEQIALLDLTTWGSGLETLTPAATRLLWFVQWLPGFFSIKEMTPAIC